MAAAGTQSFLITTEVVRPRDGRLLACSTGAGDAVVVDNRTMCASSGRPCGRGQGAQFLVDWTWAGVARLPAGRGRRARGAHGDAGNVAQPARLQGYAGHCASRAGLREPAQDLAIADEPPHEDARPVREERPACRDRQRRSSGTFNIGSDLKGLTSCRADRTVFMDLDDIGGSGQGRWRLR